MDLNPTMTHGYNPLNEPDKALDLLYELDTQLKEEDISISQVRAAEKEMFSFLEIRKSEYLTPKLLISIYDKLRESESLIEALKKQSLKDITEEINYLKPYLARLGNPSELSEAEAYLIQYACVRDYKQLLIRRANKILHEFEKYSQELAKTQALILQEEDLTREEEEKILEKINEISFYLQTLENRLNRHRDSVPTKYKMLINNLQQNPHLAIIKESLMYF